MKREIAPREALQGSIQVPGDKSISHRALILSALAAGRSRISNFLPSADCLATARCLEALGACMVYMRSYVVLVF